MNHEVNSIRIVTHKNCAPANLKNFRETELFEAIKLQQQCPSNFHTHKWLKSAAHKSVKKITKSNYPNDCLRIKFKPRWMKESEAISLYFRVPDLYPHNTEEEAQNFQEYTADTIKLESINLHPFFRQKEFFKWFIYYLKKENKFKFIHISNIVNQDWREYFKIKALSDPNYKLATFINPKKLLPSCGDNEFVILLGSKDSDSF